MADLRRFAAKGQLPTSAPTSVASVLTAAAYAQVALEPYSPQAGGATTCRIVAVGDAERLTTSQHPTEVVISSDGPATFHLQLEDSATRIAGAPRVLSAPGGSWKLVVLRPAAIIFVTPQDRGIRMCRDTGA